jgi:hypothetical protein
MPIGEFYDVTWGASRLWCSEITTDNSRTQVVHELAEGDDHPVQDRGLGVRRVTCQILFIEMPNEATPPLDRFLAFKAQADSGKQYLFTHPIDGPYYANLEGFNYSLDEDGNVSNCSCSFLKAGKAEQPLQAGASSSTRAGEDAVAARSEEFSSALGDVGIDSDIGTTATTAVESRADSDEVPTRQVIVDVAELSRSLVDMIETEGLEHDIKLFAAYKSTILLGAAIRAAALAALSETPRVTAIRIGVPISLLALCVRIYGGAEAEARLRQILALNDIRTPGWLAEGTVIMIPVPSTTVLARRAA